MNETPKLDPERFFVACNPTQTLNLANRGGNDYQYYIDFTPVRGSSIIRRLKRIIESNEKSNQPSCQLFTGHIGCGKSTELQRLWKELEDEGFHVVYFESTEYLQTSDVDIIDILLAITREVANSLKKVDINLEPPFFIKLFNSVAEAIRSLEFKVSFLEGLIEITRQAKDSPDVRTRLRQKLGPQTEGILEALNKDVFGKANDLLRNERKQKGLVVIVDNLDRIDNRFKEGLKRTQPEYLFIDRGDRLAQLNCHVVYTIPLVLRYSPELTNLIQSFGRPQYLPMVRVQSKERIDDDEGMYLLQQMVMARAFPQVAKEEVLSPKLVSQVFEQTESSSTTSTLSKNEILCKMCRLSGGHVRNLLRILHACITDEDPPLSKACLNRIIREHQADLLNGIEPEDWNWLYQVAQDKKVSGEEKYQRLVQNLWVLEYQNKEGESWHDIYPILRETDFFQSLRETKSSSEQS
ncbi:MAG: ATP-binding protein [Xenococcus sp. MO_188.B8]|nr:ATP-binding protein [Xenococcus sp. MO_188.B8]